MSDLPCEYGEKCGECRHPDVVDKIGGYYNIVNSELCRFGFCEDWQPDDVRRMTQSTISWTNNEHKK